MKPKSILMIFALTGYRKKFFRKKTATFCQILKDTGARCGEVAKLTWSDIYFKQHTINIKAEKRSNGRILPLNDKTIGMLANLRRKSNRIFSCSNAIAGNFYSQQKRLTQKVSNPNLLKKHFHTFRHWKATSDLHPYHDRERIQIIFRPQISKQHRNIRTHRQNALPLKLQRQLCG